MNLTVNTTAPFRLAIAALLLCVFITPAWANGPDKIPSEESPSETPQQRRDSRTVFVPGDAVYISAFPDSTSFLNGTFPIDDRGYVELPLYGKAKISHMSRDQFLNFLRENFRDYLRFPNLYVKPMIRVSVLGGVPTPGFYYFDQENSFWELMHQVGGTLDEDGLKQIRWKRDGKNVQDNMIPDLQRGASLQQIGFRSGDQIWVKTYGKPGFIEKAGRYFSFITAAASVLTVYITYQTFYLETRRTR